MKKFHYDISIEAKTETEEAKTALEVDHEALETADGRAKAVEAVLVLVLAIVDEFEQHRFSITTPGATAASNCKPTQFSLYGACI